MPLNTQIMRDGVPLDVPWDYFTLSCMYTVAIKEARPDYEYAEGKKFGDLPEGGYIDFSLAPIYYLDIPRCGLVTKGKQTLKRQHVFQRNDEETLVFEPGDVLSAYRSHK